MMRQQDCFLDQDKYDIIFKTAENLDVPIYLHPAPVNSGINQSYDKGDYPQVTGEHLLFWLWLYIDVGIHEDT